MTKIQNYFILIILMIILCSFSVFAATNATVSAGCTNFTYNNFTVHYCTQNFTINFTNSDVTQIDIFESAGGGAGGNGGGGGGGIANASNFSVNKTSYNGTIGRGAISSLYPNSNLFINATNTTFINLTAVAGGSSAFAAITRPQNGGSGGGCVGSGFGGTFIGGNGSILNGIRQGFNGSNACYSGGLPGSGGGGGAIQNGSNPSGSTGGNGGQGVNVSLWFGPGVCYLGVCSSGGGGGGDIAGTGGAGAGNGATGSNAGGNAVSGTGSGGGGIRASSVNYGGNASGGVIIIRYLLDQTPVPIINITSYTNNSRINNNTLINASLINYNQSQLKNCSVLINNISNIYKLLNFNSTYINFTILQTNHTLQNKQNFNLSIQCSGIYSPNMNYSYYFISPTITQRNNLNGVFIRKGGVLRLNYSINDTISPIFAAQYIIYAPNGSIYSQFNITNLTTNNYVLSANITTSINDMTGNYTIYVYAENSHTIESLKNYKIESKDNKISFEYDKTISSNEIKDISKITDYGYNVQTDRINDYFVLSDKEKKLKDITFIFKSTDKIYYKSDSKYKAHFVTGHIWRDYEIKDYSGETYKIIKISDYEYEITITTDKSELSFQSFGGLNNNSLTEYFTMYYDNITLQSQNPADLTSINLLQQNMTIRYNNSGNQPYNLKLNYSIMNGTGCFINVNNSCNISYNEFTLKNYSFNYTPLYDFTLYNGNVYSASYNIPERIYYDYPHNNFTLNSGNNWLSLGVSITENDSYYTFELNSQVLSGTQPLNAYYCNNNYLFNTNPSTSDSCVLVRTLQYNELFNHSHTSAVDGNIYAYHKLIILPKNGSTINGITWTNNFSIMLNIPTVGNSWTLSYINTTYYPSGNYERYSSNGGNTWSYLSGNTDYNLHHYSSGEYLNYSACANYSGINKCSASIIDYIEINTIPPSQPILNAPDGSLNYYFDNVNISYFASLPFNGYVISAYNISLYYTVNNSIALNINNNNSNNLAYIWNSTPYALTLYNQSYNIHVKAYDSIGLTSTEGISNNFYLSYCYSNWIRTNTTSCLYPVNNYTIQYIDNNSCSIPTSYPYDYNLVFNCSYNFYNGTLPQDWGFTPDKTTTAGMLGYFLFIGFFIFIVFICEISRYPALGLIAIVGGVVEGYLIMISLSIIFGLLFGVIAVLYGLIYIFRMIR